MSADDRPDGSAPHQMSEFYSYDHDLATEVVPNLSYTTQDVNEVNITWDMIGGNTKVYFQLVSSEIGHYIIAGDYDDTTLEIDGDEFQTSAGTHNILGGTTTVDDGNEDMGTAATFLINLLLLKQEVEQVPIIHFHLSHLISLHNMMLVRNNNWFKWYY